MLKQFAGVPSYNLNEEVLNLARTILRSRVGGVVGDGYGGIMFRSSINNEHSDDFCMQMNRGRSNQQAKGKKNMMM